MKTAKKKTDREKFLEDIYVRYKRLLLSTICKYVGQSHISEDIFHEVFIRIMHHAEKLSIMPQAKMEAYMIMIARGVSIDYLRKKGRNGNVDIADEIFQNSDCNIFGAPYDLLDRVDLMQMMSSLTDYERTLLMGKYYLGLSTKELSSEFGENEATIRSKIHRAKKKLLDEWVQSGLKMEDFLR